MHLAERLQQSIAASSAELGGFLKRSQASPLIGVPQQETQPVEQPSAVGVAFGGAFENPDSFLEAVGRHNPGMALDCPISGSNEPLRGVWIAGLMEMKGDPVWIGGCSWQPGREQLDGGSFFGASAVSRRRGPLGSAHG